MAKHMSHNEWTKWFKRYRESEYFFGCLKSEGIDVRRLETRR